MAQHRIYTMTFSAVYPLYVAKATRKGRTNEEVDTVIRWLTGYTKKGLETQIRRAVTLEEFFAKAPKLSPLRSLITGVICGVQIEDITDPLMREVRYLDKLIDELAKGRPMEKILRQGSASPETQIKKSGSTVHQDILRYHAMQDPSMRAICEVLAEEISRALPEATSKVWHAHPVWFLDGNPVVGYSKLKDGVRLLFWSGQSFDEPGLTDEGSFRASEKRYGDISQVKKTELRRWLGKARRIQWDYQHIVKRKGVLQRLS